MNWLTQFIEEQSIAWLLLSAIVAMLSGFLSSWLTYRFVKRQEIIDENKLQGEIRKEVETYLGDKSAEREYIFDARKRLYHAIGPLRFQLLIACRDATSRIRNYGTGSQYDMAMSGYYGLSTLYRLILPITIAELIERQISYADFSVDQTAIRILRFKKAVFMALSDGDVVLNHPNVDWHYQRDHVFSGTLSIISDLLIVHDEEVSNKKRPMSFLEFENYVQDSQNLEQYQPLTGILENFEIKKMPIFWARLVCFGYVCNEYVRQVGSSIGFEYRPYDIHDLLVVSKDDYILSNIEKYQEIFKSLVDIGL